VSFELDWIYAELRRIAIKNNGFDEKRSDTYCLMRKNISFIPAHYPPKQSTLSSLGSLSSGNEVFGSASQRFLDKLHIVEANRIRLDGFSDLIGRRSRINPQRRIKEDKFASAQLCHNVQLLYQDEERLPGNNKSSNFVNNFPNTTCNQTD
jgi:hypothetical protein